MMEILQVAVADVFAPLNIAFLLSGVAAGIVLGAIPGLTATMGITLVIPFTLTMDPSAAVLMMMGAYKGGIYGGPITAILLKAPGVTTGGGQGQRVSDRVILGSRRYIQIQENQLVSI